jgi:hypothetical protein
VSSIKSCPVDIVATAGADVVSMVRSAHSEAASSPTSGKPA